MPDKKLTDSEIVKALECCTKLRYDIQQPTVCLNCPYYNLDDCTFELKAKALDLINRLQAENERLKLQNNLMNSERELHKSGASNLILKAKAEAYKEFSERLKTEYAQGINWFGKKEHYFVNVEDIDNLLKELVGESDAES